MARDDSRLDRPQWAWIMYDWANSAYSVTLITAFFPLFFKQYWASTLTSAQSTFWMGLTISLSSLFIAFMAPIFGAIANVSNSTKRYLIIFMVIGCLATATLFLVSIGHWQLALFLYFIGSLGWSAANVFYDAMLVLVAPPLKRHWVSAVGFGMGYFGSGLFFLGCVLMTLKPQLFGLVDQSQAVRVSFILVAIWWALFSLPIIFMVNEPTQEDGVQRLNKKLMAKALKEVSHTFRDIREHREIWLFLLAYWFYIDGVDTLIRMSVDYASAIGMTTSSLLGAVLMVQFVSLPGVLFFGWFGQRYSAILGVWICIIGYVLVTILAAFMSKSWHLYSIAALIALLQGGIQSLSRSIFSLIIPQDRSAEYFGFYNMVGKSAAILGPLLIALVTIMTGNHRMSIISIGLLFLVGMYFFSRFARENTQKVT